MSWRTVVISNTGKLDYKMDYMVVRQADGTTKIHLSEIGMVIIETTAVSMTASLLCELTKRKVKVILCDEKRNPNSELISYYGSHDTSAKVRKQIEWTDTAKKLIWTEIVSEKIRKQASFLKSLGKDEHILLDGYVEEIQVGDISNREGHAAKVYFNALFGLSFTRTAEVSINAALNYGYGIILSAFNREIVANGYITQLGIFHDNMFNQFNLGSDLMEPFRPLIDREVYEMNPQKFEREEKLQLVDVINKEVIIDTKHNFVGNAIKIYCKSVFDALKDNDISLIRFYRDEL
jgi:CRISPR-associated endonuclease Cas1